MNGLAALVPAKVNLYLAIGKRRADGYHSLVTLFHPVGLWDEVRISSSARFHFTASGLPVPRGSRNLCVRACRLLQEHYPAARGVRIHLVKRIPPGAGLGGGSADAAACLAGLNRFLKLAIGPDQLRRLARRLGADVPAFLTGGAALGKGRGDELTPVRSRLKAWAAVLKPGFGIRTAAAYRAYDRDRARSRARIRQSSPSESSVFRAVLAGRLASLRPHNDFQAVIEKERPKIRTMLRALEKNGALAAFLTGSGSAVVGLYRSRIRARRAARRLARELDVKGVSVPLKPLKMKLIPF